MHFTQTPQPNVINVNPCDLLDRSRSEAQFQILDDNIVGNFRDPPSHQPRGPNSRSESSFSFIAQASNRRARISEADAEVMAALGASVLGAGYSACECRLRERPARLRGGGADCRASLQDIIAEDRRKFLGLTFFYRYRRLGAGHERPLDKGPFRSAA